MATTETRSPLEDSTNSRETSPTPTPRTRSPSLRHKPTQRNLKAHLDSSESFPSVHSSIYDASLEQETPYIEPQNVKPPEWEEPPALDLGGSFPRDYEPAPWEQTVMDPNGNLVPASFLAPISPNAKDHLPHRLDPIKEQNSFATLRSRHSATPTFSQRARSRSPAHASSHKRSFSLADLPPPIECSHQHTSSSSSAPVEDDYQNLPQPNRPISLPPQRSPTPPNIPTFGSPEALKYRLPPPKSKRLRDHLGLGSPTQEQLEYRQQTVGLPKGVVMRGRDGTLVRGKFQATRSGHLPPQRVGNAVMHLPDRVNGVRREGQQVNGNAARDGRGRTEIVGNGQSRERVTERRSQSEVDEARRVSGVGVRPDVKRREGRKRLWKAVWGVCCLID